MWNPVNYVVDADIKGFFDNVNHEWLRRFLEVRIADSKFIRYIMRFLKSGIMEEGEFLKTEKGTPQGGVISPILANIYLHFVLDRWFMRTVTAETHGYMDMARYADDFVICAELKADAEQMLEMLRQRLVKFGLELSEEKTRILEFGRGAAKAAEARGTKLGTFSFLGFTHYWGKSRNGEFRLKRKTEKKRLGRALKKMAAWLKMQRNFMKLKDIWKMASLMMVGHYRYFGVSDNIRGISHFHDEVKWILFKWLNRRSQRKSFNWKSFGVYLKKFPLPQPRIYHDLYKLGI